MKKNKILLSFDVEEFDLPREHGAEISLEEGIEVSAQGLERILKVLDRTSARATFFCTGNFAAGRPDLIVRIVESGHEVACHGVDHFIPKSSDIEKSKEMVEKMAGVKVYGYRQPRMKKNNYNELKRCGYLYDSSVNPAYIPGRYNNSKMPRRPFMKNGIIEIPVSVATSMRVPMFWLALHIFPKNVYYRLAKIALKRDGYFATYFHPWEFADLAEYSAVPGYIKHNSGMSLAGRLEGLICEMQKDGGRFVTYAEFVKERYSKNEESR